MSFCISYVLSITVAGFKEYLVEFTLEHLQRLIKVNITNEVHHENQPACAKTKKLATADQYLFLATCIRFIEHLAIFVLNLKFQV